MTKRKLRVTDLPPESIGSVRDMDQVDAIFKRAFKSPPATRRDFAPVGFLNRIRWIAGKVFMKENAI